MRKIHIVGLALVAVFAYSAVAAAGAFALESVFLVNGAKVSAETSVDSELVGEMLFEDMNVPLFGKIDFSCTALEMEGAVGDEGNAKLDLVTKIEWLSCTSLTSGVTLGRVEPKNLPWLTELLLSGATFLDDILPTSGRPGYEIEVETAFGKTSDECGSSTKSVDIDNTTENDILALFLETETLDCTVGGAGQGLIVGTNLILTLSGLPLAVSEA